MSRIDSATSLCLCALLLAPLAGAQRPPLGDLHALPATDEVSTLSLAAADLDGDGDLDLVCGNGGSFLAPAEPNSIQLNGGFGFFADAPVTLPGGVEYTYGVAAVDLDGDGDLDLVEGTSADDELLENQGSAVFTVAGVLPPVMGASTSGLAWADLDGDGDPDLLASQSVSLPFSPPPPVALFVNQGAFAFTDETASAIPLPPVFGGSKAVALGDVDGDGDLDAYVGNQPQGPSDGHNYLLLGDGAGGFADATAQLPYDAWETQAVALGDVDGDGDPDVVLANGWAPSSVQANALQLNDGKGVFSEDPSALPVVVESTRAVALRDLDGDGDLDVVFANGMVAATGTLVANNLFLGDGAGAFVDASAQLGSELLDSQAVLLADLDGDLDADLVVGEGGEVADTVRWNDGAATFLAWPTPPGVPPLDEGTRGVGIADLDGDGRVDVLVGHGLNATPVLRLLLGDPLGYFADASGGVPQVAAACSHLALGDVDGDGDEDAYVVQGGQGPDMLLRNQGGGSFQDASAGLPPGQASSFRVALGDLDGDGDLDAYLGVNTADDRVVLGDGAAHFTALAGAVPADLDITGDVELADVDGDGDLDALVARYSFSAAVPSSLYLNGGAGIFSDGAALLPTTVGASREVEVGDLDADGDPDAWLSGNYDPFFIGSTPPMLLRNEGGGLFTDASAQLPSGAPAGLLLAHALVDVDGDGDLDGFSAGLLYLNDGAGNFTDDSGLLPSPWLWGSFLATGVADLDGDGDIDAYLGTGDDDHLWFGLARHLAWRHAPRLGKPLDMDVWGPPLEAFSLGWALAPGYTPLPPLGTLLLDRATLEHAASGVLDAQGRGTVTFLVPQNPGLAGVDVLWQAAVGDAFVRLTNLERTTASTF